MAWNLHKEPYNSLPPLPPHCEIETSEILKKTIEANKYLAELKGFCQTLPNPEILINTLVLQESKDSSAIENIVTTQDELYKAILHPTESLPSETKEVLWYREAIYAGLREMQRTGFFTAQLAVHIVQEIKQTTAGYRNLPGTKIANSVTHQVIYTPPDPQYIQDMMTSWEKFLNENNSLDPLVQMALMHYQLETIHPFFDGNGRAGRILNTLYLIHRNLLPFPVLYMSAHIIHEKTTYYRLLREVTERDNWQEWILFILDTISTTAKDTLQKISAMLELKQKTLILMKTISQKMPAYELNELIFGYPYIKIKVLEDKKIAKRQAASSYLQQLAEKKILKPLKIGREIYYINHQLMKILTGK